MLNGLGELFRFEGGRAFSPAIEVRSRWCLPTSGFENIDIDAWQAHWRTQVGQPSNEGRSTIEAVIFEFNRRFDSFMADLVTMLNQERATVGK